MVLRLSLLSLLFFSASCASAFQKGTASIGKVKINIEIAKSPYELQQGMMMRTSWGDIQGMLFVFNNVQKRSFWMKKTFLPLSIGFFDKNLKLVEIYDLKASKSLTQKNFDSVQSKSAVKYALEVPKGWFKKNNIEPGQILSFKPSKKD